MRYNKKKTFYALTLILATSVSLAGICYAQGAISLSEETDADELGIATEQPDIAINLASDEVAEVADAIGAVEAVDAIDTENAAETTDELSPEINATDDELADDIEIPLETSPQIVENNFSTGETDSVFPDDMPLLSPNATASVDSATKDVSTEINNLDKLGNSVLAQIDNDLFAKMSDIEKQTTLLSLELRREELKNRIAAIQAQRQKAIEEQEEEREEREQKKKDRKAEKEIQILKEKQILKDREIALEALRQEKALDDYRNKMLENNQKWIAENQKLYDDIQRLEEEKKTLVSDFITKLGVLNEAVISETEAAETALSNYNKTVSNLNLQNSQLRKRLEAETSVGTNPFSGDEELMNQNTINNDYVVMEIRGKGANLIAKLINKKGETFLVRQGTVLQSGHSVEKITNNFIVLDKKGIKNYLQFTANGVVDQEPTHSDVLVRAAAVKKATSNDDGSSSMPPLLMDDGIPSLGNGMFVK